MSFTQDPLMRIVDIRWVSGVFSFAGHIALNIVTPGGETFLGSVDSQFSWLGGTSRDGDTWESSGPTDADLALFCCVRGKVGDLFITVAAGMIVVGPFDFGPGYAVLDAAEPAGGISYDDGLTWSNAGIPLQEYVLAPPDASTGAPAETASGNCSAVAYHPASQTFYVGGSVLFSKRGDTYWEDRMYSGSGPGFSQVYSDRRELSDPFPGFRWPEIEITEDFKSSDRLRVADRTQTTPSGPGTLFVVSFGPDQHAEYTDKDGEESYVSVKEDGAGVTLGGTDISPPMPIVNSACGGSGHIVVVGWEDEDRRTGPVTYVSNDDGLSWVQQLSGLSHTNPAPEDKDSGNSAGSCSFSRTR